MSDQKFCVNCKYCDETTQGFKCMHPKSHKGFDLVTGIYMGHWFCSMLRNGEVFGAENCGKEAKWFEPKESN